jgi:hypothetical protein
MKTVAAIDRKTYPSAKILSRTINNTGIVLPHISPNAFTTIPCRIACAKGNFQADVFDATVVLPVPVVATDAKTILRVESSTISEWN